MTSRARRLLRNVEGAAYWAAAAPVLARLPAALGYRIACWRGDWLFRCQAGRRAELARNLRLVLGNELSAAAAQQVTRDVVPARLLRGGRREAAAARGAAAAAAGRDPRAGTPGGRAGRGQGSHPLHRPLRLPQQRLLGAARQRLPGHHHRALVVQLHGRPLIRRAAVLGPASTPGRCGATGSGRTSSHGLAGSEVAALAAAALRANEVVTIAIDAPPLDSDRARAVEVPFLGRRAGLLPGAVTLAQVTGAPLLMGFLYRAADYRHQVLEISAPVPVEGETGDGIRALRRRGERRHPEEPGPLGILG